MTREQRDFIRTLMVKAYPALTPEQRRVADRLMWEMFCADKAEEKAA